MALKTIQRLQAKAEKLTQSGGKFSTVLDNANSLLTEGARQLVEQETQSTFEAHEDYLNSLQKNNKATEAFRQWLQDNAVDPNGDSTEKVRNIFNEWVKTLSDQQQNLVKPTGSKTQQSHIESSVLAQRTLLLYTEVNRLANLTNKTTADSQRISAIKGHGPVAQKNIDAKEQMEKAGKRYRGSGTNRAIVQRFADDLQKIYVIIKAINWADINGIKINKSGKFIDLVKLTEAFTTDAGVQADWFKMKETDINILSGKAKQKLKIEVRPSERIQEAEQLAGSMLKNVWDRSLNNISNVKQWQDIDWTNTEGSKSLEGEIVEQITKRAAGKKVTPYKSGSKTTLKPKRKKTNPSTAKRAKKIQSKYKGAKLPKAAAIPVAVRKETGKADRQKELIKLQAVINKRLSAEVRRNMGRPALINRTGRFSNSVELLRMRENSSGALSGDYTYQLSPYETFENKGVRRWSTGYNPKDLITKSIRNLAEQYTTQKFSYLRRT